MTLTHFTLVPNVPQLIFTGPGHLWLNGSCRLGPDSTVTPDAGANPGVSFPPAGLHLSSDQEVWAVFQNASNLNVLTWY